MMKYELALVLSAKIEDEERAAMVEKVQAMITTAGAAITNVDEWGKKQYKKPSGQDRTATDMSK